MANIIEKFPFVGGTSIVSKCDPSLADVATLTCPCFESDALATPLPTPPKAALGLA